MRTIKILVACEESQAVTVELRKLGHEAYSCDTEPCSGGHPEWHLQQDVILLLKEKWDMIIAFPPCTHLAVSGARHFKEKIADGRQQEGINFFMAIANADCEKIAIENPVGIISTKWRKPNQYVQPYEFGDKAQKKTGLWLKGLPNLEPTNIVDKGDFVTTGKNNKQYAKGMAWFYDENGKSYGWSHPMTAKLRSKTFPGIAKALANQYGGDIRYGKIDGITSWE